MEQATENGNENEATSAPITFPFSVLYFTFAVSPGRGPAENTTVGAAHCFAAQGEERSWSMLKVTTWNVNGIRARRQEVLDWVRGERPDVLCLQEVKASWAPWRNMHQRNIGWRLDYVLADAALAEKAVSCSVARDFGTSDHGPVMASFDMEPPRGSPGTGSPAKPSTPGQLSLF